MRPLGAALPPRVSETACLASLDPRQGSSEARHANRQRIGTWARGKAWLRAVTCRGTRFLILLRGVAGQEPEAPQSRATGFQTASRRFAGPGHTPPGCTPTPRGSRSPALVLRAHAWSHGPHQRFHTPAKSPTVSPCIPVSYLPLRVPRKIWSRLLCGRPYGNLVDVGPS
jgi:hypothetical protein